jgi:hypothetical protein
MMSRSARGSLAVCSVVLAVLVCARTGDAPCKNPWFRVGDLLRSMVRNARPPREERASQIEDSRPLEAVPVDADAEPERTGPDRR